MTDTSGRNGGNRIFTDRQISLWLAGLAAVVFGSLQLYQLTTLIDVRERLVRIETVVFPPVPFQAHGRAP